MLEKVGKFLAMSLYFIYKMSLNLPDNIAAVVHSQLVVLVMTIMNAMKTFSYTRESENRAGRALKSSSSLALMP